ncbi:MAG: acyl-[acyl-carrier-protein]--UDP-N-acetylglucosamine O-acyltransferase [Candidatus Zixiibacteriota bacterium]|nr:MAG: acyl-[acyl-carrier-protein]--UDP-N-acetylglucosamine O-acyltransferase [candidate division Zixibacteria bacterium]
MNEIHKTAIVSAKAELGKNVKIGPFAIIEDGVIVDDNTELGPGVFLATGAVLGKNVKVFKDAVIGTVPQDLKFGNEITQAIIGDNTTIREFVTINRGTDYHYKTVVGENCMIMAYAHIAHDCIIGNNVIMANSVNLAGHIEIGDFAILGGVLPVHQFVKIGCHSMIGGGFRVQQDVVPYSLAGGYPMKIAGLNLIGLKRRGFSKEALKGLQQIFKILFKSNLNTTQAVEKINSEIEIIPEIKTVLDFIESSERGLVK